jgi:hypothetical protein
LSDEKPISKFTAGGFAVWRPIGVAFSLTSTFNYYGGYRVKSYYVRQGKIKIIGA